MSELEPGAGALFVHLPRPEDRNNLNQAVVLERLPDAEGDSVSLAGIFLDETRDVPQQVISQWLRLSRKDGKLTAQYMGGISVIERDSDESPKTNEGEYWEGDQYIIAAACREEVDAVLGGQTGDVPGLLMYGDILKLYLAADQGDGEPASENGPSSHPTELRFGPVIASMGEYQPFQALV